MEVTTRRERAIESVTYVAQLLTIDLGLGLASENKKEYTVCSPILVLVRAQGIVVL